MLKLILKYLKYSGCNITLKLNPYHWRLAAVWFNTSSSWEQDVLVIELFPITIRLWIDNGDW